MSILRRGTKTTTAPTAAEARLCDGLPSMGLYPERTQKRKPLVLSIPMKIAGTIACSLVGSMIINAASLKDGALAAVSGVGIVCSTVNDVFGDPLGGVKHWFGGDKSKPGLVIQPKTPEQMEAERRQKMTELRAEADAAEMLYEDDWPLEKLKVELRVFKEKKAENARREREEERKRLQAEAEEKNQREREERAEKRLAEQRVEEAEQRAELLARATRINFGVDQTLPLREMRKEVEAAERRVATNAEYQSAHMRWVKQMEVYRERIASMPNGACPSCGTRQRVPSGFSPFGMMCGVCNGIYPREVFRNRVTFPSPPPEPEPPSSNSGFLSNFTGGFK